MTQYTVDKLPRELENFRQKLQWLLLRIGKATLIELVDMANCEGLDTLFNKADSELGSFMAAIIDTNHAQLTTDQLIALVLESLLTEFPIVEQEVVSL